MYPPAADYVRLPTDPEGADTFTTSKVTGSRRRLSYYLRPVVVARALCVLVAALVTGRFVFNLVRGPPPKAFAFDDDPRPGWLDAKPPGLPTRLRVAVISRADEFDIRDTLREAVFRGVRETEVKLDFRFFVGAPTGLFKSWTRSKLEREIVEHGDIVHLDDIDDVKERISEKRFAALKWGGSIPRDEYDWFMTLDSDTFVRFGALSKRLIHMSSEWGMNPHNHSMLLGRMAAHRLYWENRILDSHEEGAWEEDLYLKGPWFDYPIGIGYMLSPFLVEMLLSLDPPPPHHIHYPYDDVMIGSWVSALKHFPDTSATFETTEEHSSEPIHKVVPRPYLPYTVDTLVVNDKEGWHDYVGRKKDYDAPVSWDSVCVHHVRPKEMRVLRGLEAIKGEWV